MSFWESEISSQKVNFEEILRNLRESNDVAMKMKSENHHEEMEEIKKKKSIEDAIDLVPNSIIRRGQ